MLTQVVERIDELYNRDNPNDITVYLNGVPQVNLTIPAGNNGQGFVCYAPINAPAANIVNEEK